MNNKKEIGTMNLNRIDFSFFTPFCYITIVHYSVFYLYKIQSYCKDFIYLPLQWKEHTD